MNDAELADTIGAGDESEGEEMFADLGRFETGAIPVDAVVRQGKAIRTRRRVVGGGVLAVAAALTIAVPVALAGGGPGVAPTSGHAIVVQRPTEDAAQKVTFTGSIDGKAWSQTFLSHCGKPQNDPTAHCLNRMVAADKSPVENIVLDDWRRDGDFYSAEFGPDTDYVVLTLTTGDQVTVPGVVTDDGRHMAYFELPRRTGVAQVYAYDRAGRQIAHTTPANAARAPHLYDLRGWYRADGGKLDTSVPTVVVAKGQTGGVAWHIDVQIGVYDRCFSYTIATRATADMCPDFGARVYMDGEYNPGVKDGVVLGEVDPETTRVDVTFKDGTVQHLVPVRSNGHAFVGTYIPADAAPVYVKPVTGTNG